MLLLPLIAPLNDRRGEDNLLCGIRAAYGVSGCCVERSTPDAGGGPVALLRIDVTGGVYHHRGDICEGGVACGGDCTVFYDGGGDTKGAVIPYFIVQCKKRLSGGGDAFGCIFIGTGDEQLLIACTPIEAESGGLTVRVGVSCAAAFLEGGDEAGEGGGEVIVAFFVFCD